MSKLFWIGAAAMGGVAFYATQKDNPPQIVKKLRFALASEGMMDVDGKLVAYAEETADKAASAMLYDWAKAGQSKGFRIFYMKKEDGKLLLIRWPDKASPSGKWHLLESLSFGKKSLLS